MSRSRRRAGALLLLLGALAFPMIAPAQDRAATLADIRSQLTQLSRDLDGLKAELQPSGRPATPLAPGSALERLDALEAEMRRLTALSEELNFRIGRIANDGATRVDDLNFRLTELEGGDIAALKPSEPLGGSGGPLAPMRPPVHDPDPELAMGEQAAFNAAQNALQGGQAAAAVAQFDQFLADYPRSPLAPAAHLARGQALSQAGQGANAGRAYLEAFTLAETSDPGLAAAALLGLGQSLAELGQTREACLALEQLGARFPDSPAAPAADAALRDMTCP